MVLNAIGILNSLIPEENTMVKMQSHGILRRPIPSGGFGRHLTSTECKSLRIHGVVCSESYIVVRQADNAYCGIVYKPCNNGFSNTAVHVVGLLTEQNAIDAHHQAFLQFFAEGGL